MTIQHRQSAWQAEAHWTHMGVGRGSETSGAAAEDLCARSELNVDFQADNGFVLGNQLRRGQRFHAGGHTEIIKAEPLARAIGPETSRSFGACPLRIAGYCERLP